MVTGIAPALKMARESHAGKTLLMCFGFWGFRRLFGQFDSRGEIKGAAQKGIISMIGRWLK